MITREGSVIIVMTLFFFLVAINIKVGWLYMLIAILLSILLISIIYPFLTISGIEVEREVSRWCYEDDFSTVKLSIKNRGRNTKYLLTVEDFFPSEENGKKSHSFYINLIKAGEKKEVTYRARACKRGIYTFSSPRIQSRAPFGIFRARKILKEKEKTGLIIFPRIYKIQQLLFKGMGDPATGRKSSSVKTGHSIDFLGIREYMPGDSLRFIHWRSTAKLNKPMIKEFEMDSFPPVTIIIDCNRNLHKGSGKENTLEYALRFAASISIYLNRKKTPLKLIALDGEEKLSTGLNIKDHLTWLSSIEGKEKRCLSETIKKIVPHISSGGNLIICTPDCSFNEESLKENIRKISSIQILYMEPDSFDENKKEETDEIKREKTFYNIRKVFYKKGDDPDLFLKKLLGR